jgi:type III secretory pathway component EscS
LEFNSAYQMIPLKWKIYRVLNYLLLCCGIILTLNFFRLMINAFDRDFLILSISVTLIFLLMASHSLINIFIMSKTFPDKILSPNKTKWHIFSLVLNLLSLIGLVIVFISALSDISDDFFNGLLIILAVMLVLVLSSLYVLICQFNLRKYLKQKNTSLMNSLIESIGSDTESPG